MRSVRLTNKLVQVPQRNCTVAWSLGEASKEGEGTMVGLAGSAELALAVAQERNREVAVAAVPSPLRAVGIPQRVSADTPPAT